MGKNIRVIFSRCAILILLQGIFISETRAQLHGNYTINPSASASATNYKTFASAVSDLSSGTRADGGTVNGPGVSTAVLFTISSSTYSEQVMIPITTGNVTGASSTNTITFDGGTGNANNVILTSSGTSGNYATLVFNGCNHVVFKNITINNTNSSNGFGVVFYSCSPVPHFPAYPPLANIPCSNNKLQNCIINTVSSSSSNITGVFFGDSLLALDPFANANYDTIDRCSIHGGYYSIYMTYDTENVFSNDSLLNAYKGGMHISTSAGFKIRNNYISSNSSSMSSTNNIAIQIIGGATSTSTDYAEISGNTIYQFSQIGIALQSTPGSSSYPTRIFNNFIGGGIPTGSSNVFGCIYTTSSTGYINFWNNSLALNTSGVNTNSACIELLSTGGNWSIENDIFTYTGSSSTHGEGIYAPSGDLSSSTVDYNIFYNPTDSNLEATLNGTAYTKSTIVGGGGFNGHSQVSNPYFVSTTVTSPDLDISVQCARGIAISYVTKDIHGTTRANPPCIGGDEIPSGVPDSAGAISGPTSVCQGYYGITYTVPTIANATGYVWTLPGGASIASGANTHSIRVNFSPSTVSGVISIYGTGSCGNGGASSLDISINTKCLLMVNGNGTHRSNVICNSIPSNQ